jgi:hypothetical protein
VFVEIFNRLAQHRMLDRFRVLGDHLFVSLDGTTYFAYKTIHCSHCLPRHLSNGQTLYYHAAIPPSLGAPARPAVIALPPRGHHTARRGDQTGLRTAGGQTEAQPTCLGCGTSAGDLTGRCSLQQAAVLCLGPATGLSLHLDVQA